MSERENPFLIPDLITEDGAVHELATSADMQPKVDPVVKTIFGPQ